MLVELSCLHDVIFVTIPAARHNGTSSTISECAVRSTWKKSVFFGSKRSSTFPAFVLLVLVVLCTYLSFAQLDMSDKQSLIARTIETNRGILIGCSAIVHRAVCVL
jgi:hypothetical protein